MAQRGRNNAGDRPAIETVCAAQLSVFTSSRDPLTKRFRLVDGAIHKETLANFTAGQAETRDAPTPAALVALLDGLTSHQALSAGILKAGGKAAIRTAQKARETGGTARTLEHFHFPEGPGWLLWDFDAKSMPQDVADRIEALGGPLAALFSIWPEAEAAPYVIRPSSSGGVSAPGCAELVSNGLHGFFLIEDVSRSREALDTLQARAWAAGLAWVALSKSGALLVRSIVDVAVGSPERLIFEAPPVLVAPVVRTPKPSIVSDALVPVPVPDLDPATAEAAEAAEAEARRRIRPEAVRVEAAFVEERAQAVAKRSGQSVDQARNLVRQMLKGSVLADDHILELRDGSLMRVGDILDAPKDFDRVSLPDPIEGLPYGPDKATLLLRPDPRRPDVPPRLVSHAHGKTTVYRFARYETKPTDTQDPPAGPTLRPAKAAPDVLEVGLARARLRSEVRDGLRRPGVSLIEATLGLGKTHATIGELVELLAEAMEQGIESPAAVIAAPMHRLGRQLLADIQAEAPGVDVVQIYGAEAQDPDDPSQTVCKQLDAYRERASLLLDTDPLCASCPFAKACLHLESKAKPATIYVVSHERLKAARTPLKRGQTLVATVVDESPLNALVSVGRRPVPLAALMASPTWIPNKDGWSMSEGELIGFRQKIDATIRTHGPGYLRLSGLSGWTAAQAREAFALEWRRKITDEDSPDLKGNKTLPILTGILSEIERTIEGGIEENARLWIQEGEMGLEVSLCGLKPIGEAFRKAPVLMLDATAEAEVVQLLAGEPLAHHAVIRARENVVIEQDPDWSGAKSKFFEKGEATGNLARVRRFAELEALSGKTVAIGNKDTIAAMGLPEYIPAAHFNALRGLNDFADAQTLVIVGRTLPNGEALSRMVAAIWGTPCVGSLCPDGKVWRLVASGDAVMEAETKAATHEDPRAQLVLKLIRDAEVAQAVGRLRAVNRAEPVRCILLSDAVVDYPVRLVSLKQTLWACGVVGEMLERGVAFLSPSQASAAYPDLYASKQAAAKVLDRISDRATFSIIGLYGKGCRVVSLRRARATVAGQAIVSPAIEDAEAAIKALLPDAEVLHEKRPAAAPAKSANVQNSAIEPVAAPDRASANVQDLPTEPPAVPDTFASVGALAAQLVRALPPAPVVDLSKARRARADLLADEQFAKALALVDRIRQARRKAAEGPSAPVRVSASGGVVPVAVAAPAPRLVWVVDPEAKPKPLPHVLRRYAVTAAGVVKVWDRAVEDLARAGAEAVRDAVEAWQGLTEYDPDAWA